MTRVFEDAVALPVPDDVWLALANRQRRRGPDSARVFIAQVDNFTRRIADDIIGPRRQTILATVNRPRAAATSLSNQEPEIDIVTNDIGPRRGRPLFRAENGDVFTPALVETAEAVEERQVWLRHRHFRIRLGRNARYERRRQWLFNSRTLDLILEGPALRDNHNARHGV